MGERWASLGYAFLAGTWIAVALGALIVSMALADFTTFYGVVLSGVLVCAALALKRRG